MIYKQLDVIVQRLNIISKCKNSVVEVEDYDWSTDRKMTVKIKTHWSWNQPEIYFCGNTSPNSSWFKKEGIVTLWNQLGLYEKLEKKCERQLEFMINEQNDKTNYINANYDNMINC